MLNNISQGARSIIYIGAALALLLALVILSPRLLPQEPGGTLSPGYQPSAVQISTQTPAQTPTQALIMAKSALFQQLVWEKDTKLGYGMLRPAGWSSEEQSSAARIFVPGTPPGSDTVSLSVTNYKILAEGLGQGGRVVQWELFKANPNLEDWTRACLNSWEMYNARSENQQKPIFSMEHATGRAKIYSLQISPGVMGLVAYLVDQGIPYAVTLELRGDFADMSRVRELGIFDDFVTIVDSFNKTPGSGSENVTAEFELYFYRPLVIDYNLALWEDRSEPDNKEKMVNYLQHRVLKSCTVGVRGPSGFYPTDMPDVTLGDITYQVYQEELPGGTVVQNYFFKSATTNEFDEVVKTLGIPIFEVQSSPSEAQDCLAAAEILFASLHDSMQPAK
jgi:hypothetical protein